MSEDVNVARWTRGRDRLVLKPDGRLYERQHPCMQYTALTGSYSLESAKGYAATVGYRLHCTTEIGRGESQPLGFGMKVLPWADQLPPAIRAAPRAAVALSAEEMAERIERYAARAAAGLPLFNAPPKKLTPVKAAGQAARGPTARPRKREPDEPRMTRCRKCQEWRLLFPGKLGHCDDCFAARAAKQRPELAAG